MVPTIPFRGDPGQVKKEHDAVRFGLAGKTIMAPRRRRPVYDAMQTITTPSLRRLARRGGVRRISAGFDGETRIAMRDYLRKVLRICVMYVEHRNAKTVTVLDVIHALHGLGRTLYGFDPDTNQSKDKKIRLRT